MPHYKLFAPLVNARDNFRSLALPAPFTVERWTRARIIRMWREFADLPRHEIEIQAESSQCLPGGAKYGHVVVAEVQAPTASAEATWREAHEQFDRCNEVLKTQFRLVSLYLSADVEPIVYFWYSEESGKPQMESGLGIGEPKCSRPGFITRYNLESVNDFLATTTLPLQPDYIQLAFEHWEESLRASREAFQLLSLVTALEALFNVGAQDIRYRIARSVAVLLGRDDAHSDEIFESVSKAYEVRSKLVHTGKAKGLDKIWTHGLRNEVRDAILACQRLRLPKEELARQLTRLGFGAGAEVTRTLSLYRQGP